MSDGAILVFTGRGFNTIVEEGGSQAWVLDPQRARRCAYIVCTQNRYGGEWGMPESPHGSAFLVGKIDGVVPSEESEDKPRWLVRISEYARIDVPELWDGGRNPVRYTTLQELGIDPVTLTFEVPEPASAGPAAAQSACGGEGARPLNIAEAKRGLAAYFGVGLDAIEITIRG